MLQASADYERWRRVLSGERLPAALVDLDALEANLDTLLAAVGREGVTLRIASKSVRLPWLLRHVAERGGDRVRGLMTFSAPECAWLAEQGFRDLFLAYPVARPDEARVLADLAQRGVEVLCAVDQAPHVALLSEAALSIDADSPPEVAVAIDVDVSWRPFGGWAHVGVRRSPVRSAADAARLADAIASTPGVRLGGVMAYEAQVAGLPDRNAGSRALDPIRRWVKAVSRRGAAARRREVVAALGAAGHALTLVNGGGTGSVRSTSRDPSVTEVTVGSGLLCPHLFDGYRGLDLRPAVFFVVGVVRRSDPGFVTCAGGGYPASGGAGADRLPRVHLPLGLRPIALEGFGEVQTPFRVARGAPPPALGDPVLCRHAKAGELFERFSEALMVRGDRIVARAPTYRGAGLCFG